MIKQTVEVTTNTNDIRVSHQVSQALKQWQSQLLRQLRQEPGKPHYPIRWTSERQRKYVMAKLRRMGQIPYQRTGALVAAWEVNVNIQQVSRIEQWRVEVLTFLTKLGIGSPPTAPPASVIVEVSNSSEIEQFVTGIHQQGYHQDTGWYYAPTVLDKAFRQVEGIVNDL